MTYTDEEKRKKNVLQQQFRANGPNEIWASGVTCFTLNNRYYYICVILDLLSRKVISYKISKKNSTQLITPTFKNAWELRNPKSGLLFHSDCGVQYASHRLQQMLHEYAVVQSFLIRESLMIVLSLNRFFVIQKGETLSGGLCL